MNICVYIFSVYIYIYIYICGFRNMQDWQHFHFEKALAEGKDCLEYVWPSYEPGEDADKVNRESYRVCLVNMTQTNVNTRVKHALLRLDMNVSTPIWQWFVFLHGEYQPISMQDW